MGRKKEEAELLAPDPFLETLNKWASWVQKHLKPLLISVAGAFAVILGYEFLSSQTEHDASVITSQLTEAIRAYDEATDPQKVFTSTRANGLDPELEHARTKLQEIGKAHPNSGASQLALLYEADVARRLRKHDEAEGLYKAYVDQAKPDDALLFIALEGAGYAAEDQGHLDEALKYFGRLADGTGFYKDYGLKHKARVLKKKGDRDGAMAALKQIVDMQPPSDLKSAAEEELKTLE
jgi:tetratricopeptide (TPR) repeat protein